MWHVINVFPRISRRILDLEAQIPKRLIQPLQVDPGPNAKDQRLDPPLPQQTYPQILIQPRLEHAQIPLLSRHCRLVLHHRAALHHRLRLIQPPLHLGLETPLPAPPLRLLSTIIHHSHRPLLLLTLGQRPQQKPRRPPPTPPLHPHRPLALVAIHIKLHPRRQTAIVPRQHRIRRIDIPHERVNRQRSRQRRPPVRRQRGEARAQRRAARLVERAVVELGAGREAAVDALRRRRRRRGGDGVAAEIVQPAHAEEPAVRRREPLDTVAPAVELDQPEERAAVAEGLVADGGELDLQGGGEALDDEAFEEGLREVEAAVEEGGAAGEGWGFGGGGGRGEGGAKVVELAVGAEEGGEGDAVGLGGDAGQGDRGVEVREGAVDDADAAELVAGGEMGGREGGEGEAEAEGNRKVDELCGGGGVSSGDDGGRGGRYKPLAVAFSSLYVLSSFHPVAL